MASPPAPEPRPRVVVVGLGPGDRRLVTARAEEALRSAGAAVFLRTGRHPSAAVAAGAATFDEVYESSSAIEQVYATIVERLVAAAQQGPVVYGVPGSPLVAERTVELLRAEQRVEVEMVAGVSFVDLAWSRLGVDPFVAGARLVDGQRFATAAAGDRGPFLVAQCDSDLVLSEVKLALDDAGAGSVGVTVLARLGLPDESVCRVEVADLDRDVVPDHLTTLWIPQLSAPVAGELARLDELVRTLRQCCPWDREQTHRSLTRHLLEETYEVLEAIDELPPDADAGAPVTDDVGYTHLEEELGDLLFQVVFHAALAAEAGRFTLSDVAASVHDKLVQRHPHVFAGVDAATAGEVMANWEQIKKAEKGRASVMDGIPVALPSALYAAKLQGKAASLGFDWDDVSGAVAKIGEERDEMVAALATGAGEDRIFDEVGDLLFAVVNVARHLNLDPEAALRHAAGKFRRRVVAVESLAARQGRALADLDAAALDAFWNEVKSALP